MQVRQGGEWMWSLRWKRSCAFAVMQRSLTEVNSLSTLWTLGDLQVCLTVLQSMLSLNLREDQSICSPFLPPLFPKEMSNSFFPFPTKDSLTVTLWKTMTEMAKFKITSSVSQQSFLLVWGGYWLLRTGVNAQKERWKDLPKKLVGLWLTRSSKLKHFLENLDCTLF